MPGGPAIKASVAKKSWVFDKLNKFFRPNFINPVDPSTLEFEDLLLSDPVWDDLRVPATNTMLTPSKSEPAFESLIDGLYVYKFDVTNADDESIHFVTQMPHNYQEGSNLRPHVHWCPDNTNTGDVYWSFEYSIVNVNETIGNSTIDNKVDAADGISLKHQVMGFTEIDGSNLLISHILICRLTRKSTSEATDTFTGNACFLEFDFHYEIDTLGSRQEYIK